MQRDGNVALIVLTVTVTLVAVGFLLYKNDILFRYKNTSSSQIVAATPNPDSPDGEKCSSNTAAIGRDGIYKNEQGGFSVKIPDGWTLMELCKDEMVYQVNFKAPDDGEPVSKDPKCIPCHTYVRQFQISIAPRGNEDLKSLREKVGKDFTYGEDTAKISTVAVGGQKGLKVTGFFGGKFETYYILGNNWIYTVDHLEYVEFGNVRDPKYNDLFNEFMRSLEFKD